MQWLKRDEVTEPGDCLFRVTSLPKVGFMKVVVFRRQLSYDDGLVLQAPHIGETHQRSWQSEFRFFGPIPRCEG